MDRDPFKEYIMQSEPEKRYKCYAWHIAIGLQAVDGLKPSKYLMDTAVKNIEGSISFDEAQELLNTYQKKIAELTDLSERTIKRRTVEMQEKGFIARENGKRNGRWVVKISD